MLKLNFTWAAGQPPEATVEAGDIHEHSMKVRGIPGLRRHVVLEAIPNLGAVDEVKAKNSLFPDCWRGEDLWFDSMADLQKASRSPQWRAMLEDEFRLAVGEPDTDLFIVEEEFRTPAASPPGDESSGSIVWVRGMWGVPSGSSTTDVDHHYFDVHVPRVRRLPKLHRHLVLKAVASPSGRPVTCWRSAEAWFGSMEESNQLLQSPERQWSLDDGFVDMVADLRLYAFRVEEEWRSD